MLPASSANPVVDTMLTLPSHTSANAIAEACRETYLAFINESSSWGKADLALWLMGPYDHVVRHVGPLDARRAESVMPPSLNEIDARFVDRLLENTRAEVLDVLRSLKNPEDAASFAFTRLGNEHVVRCEDAGGCAAFIPAAGIRRLADRVLSLVAVDYLMRPTEYEHMMTFCEDCQTVTFASSGNEDGVCERHASGIFSYGSIHDRQTLPYMPEGA